MGLHPAFAAGEAPQADVRKLLGSSRTKLKVGEANHCSTDQWGLPLATVFGQKASRRVLLALAHA